MLIKGESRQEWIRWVDDLVHRFQPADNVERMVVEEMASASWRARRAARMEAELIDAGAACLEDLDGPARTPREEFRRSALAYGRSAGYEKAILELSRQTDRLNRLWMRLHAKLKELQKDRAADPPPPPQPEKSEPEAQSAAPREKMKSEPGAPERTRTTASPGGGFARSLWRESGEAA